MEKMDVISEILLFNRDLDPRRVRLKFHRMREEAFSFFRATCHLFYRTLPQDSIFTQAPKVWTSGDLHLENFGSYKGDNRLAYFDLNDFDEACLAPCTLELLRVLTSILVASDRFKLSARLQTDLCESFISSYCSEAMSEKPRWIERSLSKGLIRNLFKAVKSIDRRSFLESRSRVKGKKRRLIIDGEKAFATPKKESEEVLKILESFAEMQKKPEFYRVIDIADRISGLGSLGVSRYVLLVEGRGTPSGNFLLDLKEAKSSSLGKVFSSLQPHWENDAERVVRIQKRCQAISPALLTTLSINGRPFILKELQPSEHRVNLDRWKGKLLEKEEVLGSMGALSAWAQIRSSGYGGAASSEEIAHFASEDNWASGLIEYAFEKARLFQEYYRDYCRAFDDRVFEEN
ncbi:MAG: DUF2252 domain-containing protein [Leptospirillum sp.]|jgi:uncharacterized protein (DUF2252 family)